MNIFANGCTIGIAVPLFLQNVAKDWFQTAEFMCRKRLLCPLCRKHFLISLSFLEKRIFEMHQPIHFLLC